MTNSDPRATIVETAKAALDYLKSYGDFDMVFDDDTDYIPAAYEILGACLAAITDDTPNEACAGLIERVKNPPETDEDRCLHDDLWTAPFDSPLLTEFDYYGHLTRMNTTIQET